MKATPLAADCTKRCEFCNDIGHIEEGCFHRDPLQMIISPPAIGYPDGKIPNQLLIKHQAPHNLYQARISTASELSGDLHGLKKFSKKDIYDWDNTLPSATHVILSSLTTSPQLPLPSKPTSNDLPTDPRLAVVKIPADSYLTSRTMESPTIEKIQIMLNSTTS
jgi:hypothetical protein